MNKAELIASMRKLGAVLDEANRSGRPVSSDIIAEYESIVQSIHRLEYPPAQDQENTEEEVDRKLRSLVGHLPPLVDDYETVRSQYDLMALKYGKESAKAMLEQTIKTYLPK